MGLSLPFILEVVSSTTAYRQDEHEIERVHKNGNHRWATTSPRAAMSLALNKQSVMEVA